MKISKHWLQTSEPGDDAFLLPPLPTANHGDEITPLYLLMHYTASTTLASATSWFLNPAAEASAHVVIDRDGRMVQMVPFNLRAWHAGQSRWGELTRLNGFSIGIELVNAGKLSKGSDGNWYSYSGQPIPAAEVGIATRGSALWLALLHRRTTGTGHGTGCAAAGAIPLAGRAVARTGKPRAQGGYRAAVSAGKLSRQGNGAQGLASGQAQCLLCLPYFVHRSPPCIPRL